MDALLRVSPSKVIEAARTGSYRAIEALSRNPLKSVPNVHKPEVVVIFCAHIRNTPIGPRKYHDLIGRCFVGLSILLHAPDALYIPDVMDTWPTMIKWSTHFSQELEQGHHSAQYALDSHMHIIHLLAIDSNLRSHVVATPDAIQFVTAMWLKADVNVLPLGAYPRAATTLAQLLAHAPTPIIDLISSSGASIPDVATRIVHPLRVALAAHPPPREAFFQAYLWLLEGFSHTPAAAHLVPAILSAGAVRCVARTLLRFSRLDVHEDGPDLISGYCISHCLRVLYRLLQMGTGIPWVAQSVRHGLLEALVNIAPHLHTHKEDVQKLCIALVKDILPRYFLFRSVIKAVGRALERLEDGPSIALVQSRAFADSWAYLKEFAEECIGIRNTWPFRVCGHVGVCLCACCRGLLTHATQCAKGGLRSTFRRCARCRERYYCSVACQAAHWKKSHKAHCVRWVAPTVQLGGLVSVHEQEFHVMWVRFNAHTLAASITALRLAPDASPGRNQYLSSLCIVLNCTLSPWELHIRRLNEGERETTRKGADLGVYLESIVLLGQEETRVHAFVFHTILASAEATMIDYVLDRIPVEYGGRGIFLLGETG
ncbi:hypothetical protein FA95DRAFT_1402242 [Auriscalpium vulgare]|uniref:Uncharacterized protein n=1 Tax=Auriscalpium vulgare TaxID=40419 RepID=A0ACB8RQ50_9AGAM|nr:hypothetical protein FA95DRAFT_1402242 [Auriscalpium vulgare]